MTMGHCLESKLILINKNISIKATILIRCHLALRLKMTKGLSHQGP
uniref:Uncharacterized protein n=1 Tax=Anguilla anguilla TaxID=7936 RepID=A0A0E9QJM4_ANGAN